MPGSRIGFGCAWFGWRLDERPVLQKPKYQRKKVHTLHGRSVAFWILIGHATMQRMQ
jgi:hypothetical protein